MASAPAVASDELVTGEAVALDVRGASVMLRAAGALIDALTYLVGFGLIAWGLANTGVDAAMGRALIILALVFCLVIVPMIVETASHGRSLGKLAIGARVVRDDGGGISLRHAFVRALTGAVEVYLTLGSIAIVTGLLNERAKRLGDLLAGTHSQVERVPAYRPPALGVPPGMEAWAVTADVARMPNRTALKIAQFLAEAASYTPETRSRVAGELAREASAYVWPLPNVPAEVFLAAVAAVRRQRDAAALQLEAAALTRLRAALTGTPHGFPDR